MLNFRVVSVRVIIVIVLLGALVARREMPRVPCYNEVVRLVSNGLRVFRRVRASLAVNWRRRLLLLAVWHNYPGWFSFRDLLRICLISLVVCKMLRRACIAPTRRPAVLVRLLMSKGVLVRAMRVVTVLWSALRGGPWSG